jgi:hypothetical protein
MGIAKARPAPGYRAYALGACHAAAYVSALALGRAADQPDPSKHVADGHVGDYREGWADTIAAYRRKAAAATPY